MIWLKSKTGNGFNFFLNDLINIGKDGNANFFLMECGFRNIF